MKLQNFNTFFQGSALEFLLKSINTALDEDGSDLTSRAIFAPEQQSTAMLVAKEASIVAGLPVIPIVLKQAERFEYSPWECSFAVEEGSTVKEGTVLAEVTASTRLILKAERIFLNFITHMSGIANLTAKYVKELEQSPSRLLDTRKTLPGLRYPEKYAVLAGGGYNHRFNLEDMLMLKDNHIDAAGGISAAVKTLRATYAPCPPIEVECRNLAEVEEAVNAAADRIMLDNMDIPTASKAMGLIPQTIETEISGGVSLDSIGKLGRITPRPPDFISVGRLTHSAPVADFSLRFKP